MDRFITFAKSQVQRIWNFGSLLIRPILDGIYYYKPQVSVKVDRQVSPSDQFPLVVMIIFFLRFFFHCFFDLVTIWVCTIDLTLRLSRYLAPLYCTKKYRYQTSFQFSKTVNEGGSCVKKCKKKEKSGTVKGQYQCPYQRPQGDPRH